MKNLLAKYANYNAWANHKIIYLMKQLDPDLWYRQTPSSFDSLFKTVLHIGNAERIWWERIHEQDQIEGFSAGEELAFKEACSKWIDQSMQWVTYLKNMEQNNGELARQLVYKNQKGEEFIQPVGDLLMHLFNHSTYHRGQLVTMLRALGVVDIPQTDYIVWSRTQSL